jgi:hypothetical protein
VDHRHLLVVEEVTGEVLVALDAGTDGSELPYCRLAVDEEVETAVRDGAGQGTKRSATGGC